MKYTFIIITTAMLMLALGACYYYWGKYTFTTYFCFCGANKKEVKILICVIYNNEYMGDKIEGVPAVGVHNHRWHYLCDISQSWGGDKECGDGFGLQLHVFYQVDEMVKNGIINKKESEDLKRLILNDEFENEGRNIKSIINSIKR